MKTMRFAQDRERGVALAPRLFSKPDRRCAAIPISHPKVWWSYYRLLSDYVARCRSCQPRPGIPLSCTLGAPQCAQSQM